MSNTQNTAAIAEFEQGVPAFVQERTMWNDTALMNTSWRTAEMLSKASIIPQQYRGKPGDCLIAMDMANRLGISPIMVMQASQVVQGNFSWRGTACKALVDGCGKFKNSRYIMVGKEGAPTWGCKMVATRTRTGEQVIGPVVTWKMAVDEGWVNKNGSKWKTMPEMMLRYRAASFFAKTECPEVLMGFQTAEEQMDIIELEASEAQVPPAVSVSEPPLATPEEMPETALPGPEGEPDKTQEASEAPVQAERQIGLDDV